MSFPRKRESNTMKLKSKLIIAAVFITLFCAQLISYAFNSYRAKETYLYKEKIAILKTSARLAEYKDDKEDALKKYASLSEAHKDFLTNPVVSKKAKTKAKRRLAETQLKLGNSQEALRICDELLSENLNDKAALRVKAEAYWEQGKTLALEGRYDEAVSLYEEVISWNITPELTAFFKSIIANTYLQKGDTENSLLWFQNIIDEHNDLLNWPACALYRMAFIYLDNNDRDKAIGCFQLILDKYPKSVWREHASDMLKELNTANDKTKS